MTKTQFLKMEKVCKELIWKPLAKSGDEFKPTWTYMFYNQCPACEIGHYGDCMYCPVKKWRSKACYETGGEFDRWLSFNIDVRKKAARSISRYKWSWLPEHKDVKLNTEIIKYLKTVKL